MNNWKELEIDNLPPDILTGVYEFQLEDMANVGCLKIGKILNLLEAVEDGYKYYYRKPKPKAPSHKEIMSKWWKRDSGQWVKVQSYHTEGDFKKDEHYLAYNVWENKEWFTGRQSADIPPEGNP